MSGKVDAIIVGSGAGGATAARVLTERGFNVVVFEKGHDHAADSFLPYDELYFKEQERLYPAVADDPIIYMQPDGRRKHQEKWWIANMVGGATQVWDANFPRYTHEDMSVTSVIKDRPKNASVVDWPWSYEEFQPYFERAEHEWGVSGRARQSPRQEPHRDGYDYPMPPIRPHASTPTLKRLLEAKGLHPYLGAKAVNSVTYGGRPAWPFSGFFARFVDPTNSRATASNAMLPIALATGRCELKTGACVVRVRHKKGKVKGVFYKESPTGPTKHMAAPLVLVSVQAIESARLFLLSEIPDPNKMIGRYLTYHTKGSVTVRFKGTPVWDGGVDTAYQPRTGVGSLEIRDFYTFSDSDGNRIKGGKFAAFDPVTTSTPVALANRNPGWGESWCKRLDEARTNARAGFSFTGESLSVYDNRVELDDKVTDPWGLQVARTHYQHHPYDLNSAKNAVRRLAEVFDTDGCEILSAWSPGKPDNSGYGHNHGTLRAGIDPAASVLDSSCQSHEVKGLYVLDCAFMPTSGASNPTLTLLANAYRVCDKIPKP